MIRGTASAPCVDMDGLVRVTPLAILALAGLSMDILRISASVPPRAVLGIITYVGGLLGLDGRQTALKISRRMGGRSHDHLTRLTAEDRWECSQLIMAFIQLISMLGGQGWFILDDTLIPHPRSKKMEGVYWDYDHAEGRNVYGQRLVLLLWSDGFWRIPVGFAFWHKEGARPKYRTKNELARLLIRWAVIHRKLNPQFIAFDNWYASHKNFSFLKELDIPFVTRIKRNHRLFFDKRRLQARSIGRELLKAARLYRFDVLGGVGARAADVQVGDLGAMTFVVLTDEIDGESRGVKYLLASTPRFSARQVVLRYKHRWAIEVLFRDLKQHLGLTHYQGRTLAGSYRHVALTFLALLVVDHLRHGASRSFEETRAIIHRLVFFQGTDRQFHLATVVPTTPDSLDHFDEAKQILRSQLSHISQLSFKGVKQMAA